jgi:hypothetical protein
MFIKNMKKLVICLLAFCAVSCENYITRKYGGTTTINVESGFKVNNATFKDGDIWYFIEPMDEDYVPKNKKLIEKSMHGIYEGTIIFREQR